MFEAHPDLLWIGHAHDVRDPQLLFATEIAAVVDLAYEEAPAQLPRELVYCRFPLNDGGGNRPALLRQAVQTIVDLLASGTRTIVACSAGRSRSPIIAAAALSVYTGRSPHDVIGKIGSALSLEISGPLWNDVVDILPGIRDDQIL